MAISVDSAMATVVAVSSVYNARSYPHLCKYDCRVVVDNICILLLEHAPSSVSMSSVVVKCPEFSQYEYDLY
eukprot:4797110-Lingulodinium_polyedra.AAC.1